MAPRTFFNHYLFNVHNIGGHAENRTLISSMSRKRSSIDLRALVGLAGCAPAVSCTPSRRDAAFPSARTVVSLVNRSPPILNRCPVTRRPSEEEPMPATAQAKASSVARDDKIYGGTGGNRTHPGRVTADRAATTLQPQNFGRREW
jgi:hypothetical protein